MIHGHELRREGVRMLVGECRVERTKGRKKWNNCNSIINKIYFKNLNCG